MPALKRSYGTNANTNEITKEIADEIANEITKEITKEIANQITTEIAATLKFRLTKIQTLARRLDPLAMVACRVQRGHR